MFFLLYPSSVIFLSPRLLFLFVLGPFLLVLPGCLHLSISGWCLSVSGCAFVCFTTSLGGSSAWLSLCLFLSLSSLFPCLSLSFSYLSHHLFILVCLAGPVLAPWLSLFSYSYLSPSAWPFGLSSGQGPVAGAMTRVVGGLRRSLSGAFGEAVGCDGQSLLCPGANMSTSLCLSFLPGEVAVNHGLVRIN